MHPNRTYSVCNVPIAVTEPPAAAQKIVGAALDGRPLEVHLCNAFTVTLAQSDRELAAALTTADLNLPDGTPVAWLGRSHGVYMPVRGPKLVGDVVAAGLDHGLRHYLYGGHEGVAEQLACVLQKKYPTAQVVGAECPPFRPLNDEDVDTLATRVRRSGADVVWIGLGTPKQDYLVAKLAPRLSTPVVPVGAAFDFWTGRVAEAPLALQGSGWEWLYRLAKEPRRLWRRYLFGNPMFVYFIMREPVASWMRQWRR